MRLGVGITARLPRDLIRYGRTQVEALTPELTDLVIVHDDAPGYVETFAKSEATWQCIPARLGIAQAKNLCLHRLQHCDYIILLDDDIWPVASDWATSLIRAHEISRIHHFVHVPLEGALQRPWSAHFAPLQTFHYDGLSVTTWNNCSGCMLFLTQEVLRRVGGMAEFPGYYGFEHANYSQRIQKAGLMGNAGPYTVVDNWCQKIWSVDFQGLPPDLTGFVTQSSMSREEAAASVEQNLPVFARGSALYQPLVDPLLEFV
jgi:hypothetical protein